MPVFILEESTYAGPIPEDEILAAEVTAVAVKKMKYVDKETGEDVFKVEFSFVITEESVWEGQRIWGTTSTIFVDNPNCKLRAWASELLGAEELGPKFRLDTDELVGLPCRIVVKARAYEDKVTGLEKIANEVKDVIRAKAGVAPNQVRREEAPF